MPAERAVKGRSYRILAAVFCRQRAPHRQCMFCCLKYCRGGRVVAGERKQIFYTIFKDRVESIKVDGPDTFFHHQHQTTFMIITKEIDLGLGKTISIETGRMAKQADGATVVRMGDTMVIATVVSSKKHPPPTRTTFLSRLNTAKNIMPQANFPAVSSSAKPVPRKKRFSRHG